MSNLNLINRRLVRAIDENLEANYKLVQEERESKQNRGRISEKLEEIKRAGLNKMSSRDRERYLNREGELEKLRQGRYADPKEFKGKKMGDSGGEAFKEQLRGREPWAGNPVKTLRVANVSGAEALEALRR